MKTTLRNQMCEDLHLKRIIGPCRHLVRLIGFTLTSPQVKSYLAFRCISSQMRCRVSKIWTSSIRCKFSTMITWKSTLSLQMQSSCRQTQSLSSSLSRWKISEIQMASSSSRITTSANRYQRSSMQTQQRHLRLLELQLEQVWVPPSVSMSCWT